MEETKIPSVSICIPCYKTVDADVMNAIFHLDLSGLNVNIRLLKNLDVATARNIFAKSVKSDYILFIDSDVVVPSDALKKLMAADKDIIGSLCFRRKWPYPPLILFKNKNSKDEKDKYMFSLDYPSNSVVECDAIGTGCALIKTEVFKKIPFPWFRHVDTTEDIFFCERAIENGFKIFIDTGVRPAHIDEIYITEMEHIQAKREMMLFQRKESGDKSYLE